MVEGKTISTFRDIVVIVGMLILCFVGMQDVAARAQARREQEARFAVARNAIGKLDEAYKQLVANKSINEQFFRQNELVIEYQKLILTLPYMPAPMATTAPAQAPPPAKPMTQPPQSPSDPVTPPPQPPAKP
jgi:hypothetical protein